MARITCNWPRKRGSREKFTYAASELARLAPACQIRRYCAPTQTAAFDVIATPAAAERRLRGEAQLQGRQWVKIRMYNLTVASH
jgi:hypothetical protein